MRSFRAPWLVFFVGLAARLAVLIAAHPYHLSPFHDYFSFAGEAARISRALVTGFGYSDPFEGHTGPTAWIPPGHPFLIALLFKVFGVYSTGAALALFLIQCICQAWVARFVWEIAARSFDSSAGIPYPANSLARRLSHPYPTAFCAAWFWALYPGFFQYSVWWSWDTAIAAFLFSWALVIALRIRRTGESSDSYVTTNAPICGSASLNVTGTTKNNSIPWKLWLLFGLLWGLIALYNPSLLLFLPCVGIWLLCDPARTVSAQLSPVSAAAVICIALFTPWMIRNYHVFHHFIPARTNLGVELCVANCYGVNGVLGVIDQPAVSAPELAHYARVGDYQYGRDKMADFKAVVRRAPAKFFGLTLLRIDLYWFGIPGRFANPWKDAARLLAFCPFAVTGIWGTVLAWRRRRSAAGLYLSAIAILPIPYYFATLLARYRHPIEPILIATSAYLVLSAVPSWRIRPFTRITPN